MASDVAVSARSTPRRSKPPARPAKAKRTRRIGAVDSETRTALLDAAEQLMREKGYAAVTARRVAAKAGQKPQLIHYYFRNMDELLLTVWRRFADRNLTQHAIE